MFDLKEPSAIANVTELQRDFGKLIAKVRHSDVVIIRNNQPVAALVSIERLEQMQKSTVRDAVSHQAPHIPNGAKYFVDLIRNAPAHVQSRILSVTLFGSYARGDQHADSDIDLLVITKDSDNTLDEQISRWSVDAMEKTDYDDFLSAMRMTEERWNEKQRLGLLFAKEVERDGIVLWKNS